MGVRAIAVNKKNSAIWESIFSPETKGRLSFMCVVDAALLFKADPPVQTPSSPLLWDGLPQGYHFPSILMITECRDPWLCQWKVFLRKHTVQALLCGKNVNFSVFKRRGGGESEIWSDSIPIHPLPPLLSSPPSFSFSILSGFQQCVSRCLSQCL